MGLIENHQQKCEHRDLRHIVDPLCQNYFGLKKVLTIAFVILFNTAFLGIPLVYYIPYTAYKLLIRPYFLEKEEIPNIGTIDSSGYFGISKEDAFKPRSPQAQDSEKNQEKQTYDVLYKIPENPNNENKSGKKPIVNSGNFVQFNASEKDTKITNSSSNQCDLNLFNNGEGINAKNGYGRTRFHEMAQNKQTTNFEVEYFISKNPDLDFSATDAAFGNTPLMWAVANANNGVALRIIQKSSLNSLNVQSKNGNAVLHLIVGKGYDKISSWGQQLECSNYELLKKMLEQNANPNLRNNKGNTPLHLACARRDVAMIRLLLQYGAKTDALNNNDKTPLDLLKLSYAEADQLICSTVSVYLLEESAFETAEIGEFLPKK